MNRRRKWTIEDLKKHAESKGGKCLSDIFLLTTTKYLWEDAAGNQWYAQWHPIISHGKWSPFEAKLKQRASSLKFTIQDLQTFAESKGGKCLSTEYITDKTKYTWQDNKGRKFLMNWYSVKNGAWSQHEKREKLSKIKTLYTIDDLHRFAKENNGECLSDVYIGTNKYYTWKDRDGKIFKRTWYKVLKSNNLKYYETVSKGHKEIIKFLESLDIKNIEVNKKGIIGNKKELDIYLPDLNIAIEFNGCKWHHENQINKNSHKEKEELCSELNIQLIQIFDIEWKNKKEQIKSFLRSKLGKNEIKIFARKCIIKEVPHKEARDFLDKYHILGANVFRVAYGLYRNEELLSLITIGVHHRRGDELVLSRYIVKHNVTVVGGLSKLSKHAANIHNSISTWIDLRFSNGNNWVNSGWKIISTLSPDFFFYDLNKKQIIKQQNRKKDKVGTPNNMSRLEHAKLDGLVRIYDAGKLKLMYKKD